MRSESNRWLIWKLTGSFNFVLNDGAEKVGGFSIVLKILHKGPGGVLAVVAPLSKVHRQQIVVHCDHGHEIGIPGFGENYHLLHNETWLRRDDRETEKN